MQIEAILPIVMNAQTTHELEQRVALPQPNNAQAAPAVQVQEVDQIISNLAQAVEPFDIALKFSKDNDTGAIVIEMISQTTGETLQQIPNEALLRVSAALGKLQGRIFNQQA